MLSIVRSDLAFTARTMFVVIHALAIVFGSAYNGQTPDLYPNDSHHKVGWVVTLVVLSQFLIHVTGWLARVSMGQNGRQKQDAHSCTPDLDTTRIELLSTRHGNGQLSRLSSDGESVTSAGRTETSRSNSTSSSGAALMVPSPTRAVLATKAAFFVSCRGWKHLVFCFRIIDRLILPLGFVAVTTGVATVGRFFVSGRHRTYGSCRHFRIVFLTHDLCRKQEGQAIYSGLAHWIKGGVFFWLGLFTLGRWSGSFAELGWAWNVRPVVYRCQSWRRPSAEFVESGLIFIYGATNIFLEHLGSWGKDWSPQDLEHFSITVLFIGGGLVSLSVDSQVPTSWRGLGLDTRAVKTSKLATCTRIMFACAASPDATRTDPFLQCGIIIESSFVQDFLDTAVRSVYSSAPPDEHASGKCHTLEGRRISLNVVPALVILVLGFLMSSHHQSTSTSTMLHRQWGYLLMGASFARGLTYLLIYLRPPLSVLPSRPPTELLVSFGLIAGGLVFMASVSRTHTMKFKEEKHQAELTEHFHPRLQSSDTIDGMIHHELNPMVLYTVTVGIAELLMAWEMIVLAIKGWALHREMRLRVTEGT